MECIIGDITMNVSAQTITLQVQNQIFTTSYGESDFDVTL